MFRVLLTLLLLATGPGQAARGAVPGSPFGPAPPQNQAPETVDYIDVGTLYVGGSSATVNASSYFSDPDGDTLTYSVNNPSPAVASVSISGSTVTIAPVAVGTTGKIVVTAEDPGGLTATQDFNVTVENAPPPPPPNRAPTAVGSISNVTLQVGGSSATRSVSGKFSDPDGDALTFSVNDPDTSIVSVSISGSTVTIAPVAAGTTGKIIVTARDPGGLTATQDFTATVSNPTPPPPTPNRAPTAVGSISDVTLQVGGSSTTRSVSGKFSDPDGDTLTYTVNDPDTLIVSVSISGSTVTIAPVGAGATGKIIVTARDPGGLTATQDFTATVENPPPIEPNRAPVAVGSISDMTLQVGGSSGTRSVSGKFSDPDNDTLTYTVNSPNPLIAAVSISGSTVTVAPVAAGSTGKIIVTARDPDGLTATQDFTATVVNPPPPPPVVHRVTVSPETPSIEKGDTLRFSATARDSANKKISGKTFIWTSSSTSIATINSSGLATAKNAGSTTIKARTDGVSGTATLTVTEPPPVVHRVTVSPATPSNEEGETQQFTATAYDSSNKKILGKTFTWTSSATSVATIGSTGLATAKNAGSTTIKARTDGVFGTATLTVTEPPTCPMLKGSIADQTLTLGGSAAPIDLTQYFSLPVDFVPTYVVSSTDTSVTTTSLAGAMLTVTPAAAGTDTVSVTVSKQDCDSVKQSFVVTVNLPCPSAIAGAPIPDQTLVVGAGTTEIDLTQHFEHIDQDDIEITVTSPGPGIATAAIEGTSLKIDPVAAGQIAAIAVTVTDTAESDPCDPVSLSFMVTVEAAVEHPGLYPWSVSGEHVYRLTRNVGIGVEVPDQKLVVDGTVKAEGYRLRMIPADYVFEAGYDLLSLDEVASFIRNHGHLPGVASGVDMKANGLGISRMQTTLLEKIEELSLYIIAQHEQLREQGHRLASQQQKLEIQKTKVSELEQRLRRWER